MVPAGTFHFLKETNMPSLTDKAYLCFERGRIPFYSANTGNMGYPKFFVADEDGDKMLSDELFSIPVIRSLSYERRLRAGTLQYLVYKDPKLYMRVIHSELSQSYLCGVKHHPFVIPVGLTIEDTEICECCPPPKVLKTINMSRLQSHLRTRKHICTKWQITVGDLNDSVRMLKMKLRLSGVNVQN